MTLDIHQRVERLICKVRGHDWHSPVLAAAPQAESVPSGKDAAREEVPGDYLEPLGIRHRRDCVAGTINAECLRCRAEVATKAYTASQTAALTKSWKAEELVWRQNDHDNKLKMQQMQAGAETLIAQIAALRAERDQWKKIVKDVAFRTGIWPYLSGENPIPLDELRVTILSVMDAKEVVCQQVDELEREISLLQAERDELKRELFGTPDNAVWSKKQWKDNAAYWNEAWKEAIKWRDMNGERLAAAAEREISLLRERLQAEKEG